MTALFIVNAVGLSPATGNSFKWRKRAGEVNSRTARWRSSVKDLRVARTRKINKLDFYKKTALKGL